MPLYFSPLPFLWHFAGYFVIGPIITREALRGCLAGSVTRKGTVVVLSLPLADFSEYYFFGLRA